MTDKSIALALSGGGVRAMVFHMGVLKALAERNLLEKVSRISTVSGGSLLLGLILQENELKWPTSTEYLDVVYPSLREKLCTRSIMLGALKNYFTHGTGSTFYHVQMQLLKHWKRIGE